MMFPTRFPASLPQQAVGPANWQMPQRPMMPQQQMPTMPTLPQQALNANSQAWWRNGMAQPGQLQMGMPQQAGGGQVGVGGWADASQMHAQPGMPQGLPQLPPQALVNMQGQMPTLPPQAMQGMQGQMPTIPPQAMQGQMPVLPPQALANGLPFNGAMPGRAPQMPTGLLSAPIRR